MNKIVIVKAPFRISLAGGGTDIYSYCKEYGGSVVGFSINKYVVTTILPRNILGFNNVLGHTCEKFSSNVEINNQYLYGALETLKMKHNFSASVLSDAPPKTGLGGSAAFLNSFISAGKLLKKSSIDKIDVAELSSSIEIEKLKRPVGKQDHYLSSIGGMNALSFDTNINVDVENLVVQKKCEEYFNNRLMLFYSNVTRSAGKVLSSQSKSIEQSNKKILTDMKSIKELVNPMIEAIKNDNPNDIGPLIGEHWNIKRTLSKKTTNDRTTYLIDLAYKNGADGCKILGAGGGGFILVSSNEGMQQKIKNSFAKEGCKELEFCIEYNGVSSKILEN